MWRIHRSGISRRESTTGLNVLILDPTVVSLQTTLYHFADLYYSFGLLHISDMGDLGPYLEYDGEDYICTICDRCFRTEGALFAHCRATTRHEWCERCRRVFVSEDSKNAHIRASKRHNLCRSCCEPIDFETNEDLRDHLEDYHHACLECNIFFKSAEDVLSHDISVHHYCNICDRYFGNENNLRMVS